MFKLLSFVIITRFAFLSLALALRSLIIIEFAQLFMTFAFTAILKALSLCGFFSFRFGLLRLIFLLVVHFLNCYFLEESHLLFDDLLARF
jgi:hypothetical protein